MMGQTGAWNVACAAFSEARDRLMGATSFARALQSDGNCPQALVEPVAPVVLDYGAIIASRH